ncbi:hypothetical protein BaRGS_00029571 [Batillaria attramentaria]|uniref:SOCS box domain-containing protein n=1 Tax=Batillaria attramentaria TaxID=370345 RepID=A0ABD0JVZ2_9CAEN
MHLTLTSARPHQRLFRKFLAKDLISLADCRHESGVNLLSELINDIRLYTRWAHLHDFRSMLQISVQSKTCAKTYVMLSVCLESGLSTHQSLPPSVPWVDVKRPLSGAVNLGLVDLVQLLYKVRATSNAELYALSIDTLLRTRVEQQSMSELQDFLEEAASTPRTLQDLCRLKVSHLIGCRADRKHRALALNLPMSLTRQVLFQDILHPDGVTYPWHVAADWLMDEQVE